MKRLFAFLPFLGSQLFGTSETTFYLVRHGQTDWNKEKRFQGHANIPLNEEGRAQAEQVAQYLKQFSFAHGYSSDLDRAYETASIIASFNPFKIGVDQRLRERNYRSLEGITHTEFDLLSSEKRLDVENGESVCSRIFSFLEEAAQNHPGQNILIATHGGVIKDLLIKLLNLKGPSKELQVDNGALLVLKYSKGLWSIEDSKGISAPFSIKD